MHIFRRCRDLAQKQISPGQNFFVKILLMSSFIILASLTGYIFRLFGFPETNIVIIHLLAILIISWLIDGYIYGITASILATFTFNYFFTEPYYTFTVDDPSYIITFIIMTITAIITSTLTSHVKLSARTAKEKEAETRAIYTLTNLLTDADDIHDIASIAARSISNSFSYRAAVLCYTSDGVPESSFIQQINTDKQTHRRVDDIESLLYRIEGLRTSYDIGIEFYDWPIYGKESILGIIRIPIEDAETMTESQTQLFHSMIESIALAMDRFVSFEQRLKEREESTQERYRGTLLRAISHDLRTPLAGIMGTAEMLMGMTDSNEPQYPLSENIYNDAAWLHSLVENILSLTRLQEGKLIISKEIEAVEEVIGSAVNRISQRLAKHEIAVSVPEELLLVPMDARLIEQVLINLLDNAIKHTEENEEICISVKKDVTSNQAIFEVLDRGTGIDEKELPHIFKMFHTSHPDKSVQRSGIGLGLSICETIVKAHGGTIAAENRIDYPGTKIVFTLPLKEVDSEDAK